MNKMFYKSLLSIVLLGNIFSAQTLKKKSKKEEIRYRYAYLEMNGIFEMDSMRQAFFKRQAKHFFDNEAEQQAYIEHAEKEYLEATITLKDILFNSKNANRKVSKNHLIEQFEETMK